MTQQPVENGDTGFVARAKINGNFTELYTGAFGTNPPVYVSWAALAAVAGTSAQIALVAAVDVASHTDPVTGDTVANGGVYQWSSEPAGWERVADLDSQLAQVSAETAMAFSGPLYGTTALGLAATPLGEEFAVDLADGSAAIYINSAGTAVFTRNVIIAPAAPGAAALIGTTSPGGNVQAALDAIIARLVAGGL